MFDTFATLIISLLVGQAYGIECPSASSIDVMNKEGTEFVCAVRWSGKGSVNTIEGKSAAVATLVKARATTNESDDRSASSLAWVRIRAEPPLRIAF